MPDSPRLQHLPIALFAMVMGLSGLTLVWQKCASIFDLPVTIGQGLLVLTGTLFALLLSAYGVKLMRHPDAVRAELNHPVKLSFFATITISLILMGTATRHMLPDLSLTLWAVGASLHLVLTLFIVDRWMHHDHFQVKHINPAWFIPAVGNILVPIAGMTHGYEAASWFFFSIGLIFWMILLTIIFYRIIFHDPLPGRLLPTLFILIAPPAVGFIAYVDMVDAIDPFARILFNTGLFMTLLVASQIGRFARLPFFLSFWAYSFPLAAMTIATLIYQQHTGTGWAQWLSVALITVTTGVILWLSMLTLQAAGRGQICVPE
ncbi:SLAC1 anion channel family protein [Spiribacter vilamensis]|uniref:Tellurite resistance protein n=1 Tax=Spiribacter vilamensis TaxID=531306 RepID=A0A4Q8CYI3_9GAMM|nr:SLAC1 anion channel family protein [Spiribacter vilamensis]RZU98041.1 tellurite resistance protein [Spiribacter vilamensis]TVO61054.1 C4-dicarboxylate ABC transporter [Spiribacter vilamensis]